MRLTKTTIPPPKPASRLGAKRSHLTDDGTKTLCGQKMDKAGWRSITRDIPPCSRCQAGAKSVARLMRYI